MIMVARVQRVRGGGRDHGPPGARRLARIYGRALRRRDPRTQLLLHRGDPLQPAVHVGDGTRRRGGAGWRRARNRRFR